MVHILTVGVGLFVTMLVAQLILWRLVKVNREIFWLFALYLLIPLLGGIGAYATGYAGMIYLLAVGMLYLALAAAYIQTYPALRENIPSFRLLLLINRQPALTAEEIIEHMRGENLFHTKIDDLVGDGLVKREEDGKITTTTYGAILANVFRVYRGLLGLNIGHG